MFWLRVNILRRYQVWHQKNIVAWITNPPVILIPLKLLFSLKPTVINCKALQVFLCKVEHSNEPWNELVNYGNKAFSCYTISLSYIHQAAIVQDARWGGHCRRCSFSGTVQCTMDPEFGTRFWAILLVDSDVGQCLCVILHSPMFVKKVVLNFI